MQSGQGWPGSGGAGRGQDGGVGFVGTAGEGGGDRNKNTVLTKLWDALTKL